MLPPAREALLCYCELDTLAMVKVWEKDAFPDADFNYLLWDKKVRSFQIKRKIYYHKSEAYLDVICYKEREVLPDLDKTELMHCW